MLTGQSLFQHEQKPIDYLISSSLSMDNEGGDWYLEKVSSGPHDDVNFHSVLPQGKP